MRQFEVSPEAVREARACGLYGDTKARIKRMAERSCIYGSAYGNRRFEQYALKIVDGEVLSVAVLDISETRRVG